MLKRREGAVTIALVAGGVVYLVNFPDGPQTAHNHVGAANLAQQGDELPPGWIITKLELAQAGSYTEKGLPISFEVWVEPKPAQA